MAPCEFRRVACLLVAMLLGAASAQDEDMSGYHAAHLEAEELKALVSAASADGSEQKVLVKFFAPWCGHCKKLHPDYQDLAADVDGKDGKRVVMYDCTDDAKRPLCQTYGVTGYPHLKLWSAETGPDGVKYVGERNKAALAKFLEMDLEAKGGAGDDDAPVLVKPKDFQQAVDTHDATFVMFFAPWCGHCKNLHPIWETLAENAKEDSSVAVLQVDCTNPLTAPSCKKYKVRSFPQLKLFFRGDTEMRGDPEVADEERYPIVFEGSRDINTLTQYLLSKGEKKHLATLPDNRIDLTGEKIVDWFTAAKAGDATTIQEMLDEGWDIDTEDTVKERKGETALFRAATYGKLGIVQELLAAGANPDAPNVWGETPLHTACVNNKWMCMQELLDNGADTESKEADGDTPLMSVAHYTTKAVTSFIDTLIQYGADVNAENSYGQTAMHKAANRGRLEAAQVLLKHGAQLDTTDSYGRTPLHLAAGESRVELIDFLVESGAGLNIKDKSGKTPLQLARSAGKKGRDAVRPLMAHAKAAKTATGK